MNDDRGYPALTGFLMGAVVGAAVALLMAPSTGEETRRKLGEAARRVQQGAKDQLDDMKGRMGDVKDRVADRAKDVRDAVAAGRDAYTRSNTEGSIGRENV